MDYFVRLNGWNIVDHPLCMVYICWPRKHITALQAMLYTHHIWLLRMCWICEHFHLLPAAVPPRVVIWNGSIQNNVGLSLLGYFCSPTNCRGIVDNVAVSTNLTEGISLKSCHGYHPVHKYQDYRTQRAVSEYRGFRVPSMSELRIDK
jgi:hypothetical protein